MEIYNKKRIYATVLHLVSTWKYLLWKEASSSNSNFGMVGRNIQKPIHMNTENSYHQEDHGVDHDKIHDMVAEAFLAKKFNNS